MNRNFRTFSALIRTDWLISEQYAQDNLEFVNALLTGTIAPSAFFGDDEKKAERPLAFALTPGLSAGSSTPVSRYAMDDPQLPEGSVMVIDIRGPIFKKGFAGGGGTEDYVRIINQAYANEKIIGVVCLIDSPGGQVSGTPTLYDTIRNPIKPTVSVVNEGCMASAAVWLACGSDFIYATQPTDQIGSIGVFVTLRDSSEAMAKAGYKTLTVYSDRSAQKNKPMRDALAGDTKLLREDLNKTADLFRKAVETGRGDRLKPLTKGGPDIFEGAMFYADDAIDLGLIDGYGNLETAVAKVTELHNARQSGDYSATTRVEVLTGESGAPVLETPSVQGENELLPASESQAPLDSATPQSNLTSTDMSLFGNKHKVLSSLAGIEGSAITDEQLNAANAELDGLNITGARIISSTYLDEANASVAALNAANTQVASLTRERDDARAEAAKFGSQPGAVPTKSEKVEEKISTEEPTTYISETDAALARQKASMQ